MKTSKIALYIDLLFCLVLMPLIIMILPVDKWIVNNTEFLFALILYIYTLYIVYRKACLPKLFMQKKYIHIVVLIGILLLATQLFTHFPMPNEMYNDHELFIRRLHIRTNTIWFFFFIVTGFSLAIELTIELFRQKLVKHEIESQRDKAELSLYKAQINPHFLFNTLNTLYALVLSGSEKTESAFVKFSDILRYMYMQSNEILIPAEQELKYISQYVDLHKLRLNHHTKVHLDMNIDNEGIMIPPMILITFVENAFKYGSSSDTDCFIDMYISISHETLLMKIDNNVMKKRECGEKGIGLSNCRKRLELLYPGKYKLDISETKGKFRVLLKITLR